MDSPVGVHNLRVQGLILPGSNLLLIVVTLRIDFHCVEESNVITVHKSGLTRETRLVANATIIPKPENSPNSTKCKNPKPASLQLEPLNPKFFNSKP